MKGIALLLAFQWIGFILHHMGIPLPSGVIGMILMLTALFLGWVKLSWIEETASFLLKHMMLFFAPYVVGVVVFSDLFLTQWLSLAGSLFIATFAVMLVTGWTVEKMKRKTEGRPNDVD